MSSPDFLLQAELPGSARLVGQLLERLTRRCFTDCLVSARTIARKLGLSEGTVRAAVKVLEHRGFVEVVRDYGLRTRRRIRLLWRVIRHALPGPRPTTVDNAFVAQDTSVECQLTFAVMDAIPPDPPIKVSEDIIDVGSFDDPSENFAEPAEDTPPETPLFGPSSSLTPLVQQSSEEEDVSGLIQEAAVIFGSEASVESRVRAAVRQWTPDWVRKALESAARKARKGPVGWGYVVSALKTMRAEDGPLTAPTAVSNENPDAEALEADLVARINARLGLNSGGGP